MFIEIQYLITNYINRIIGHKFMYPKLIFYLIHWNLYPWILIKTQFMVFYMKCYVVWFLVTEKVWESESTDASDAEPPPVKETPKPSSPQVGIWLYISPIQYYVTWKLHVKDVSLPLQPLKVVWVFFIEMCIDWWIIILRKRLLKICQSIGRITLNTDSI